MWLLFIQAAALARPPVEVADFDAPTAVTGFPERRGPSGCAVHFEFEDAEKGWTHYRHGLTVPTAGTAPAMDPVTFMPPHDQAPPRPFLCGSDPLLENEEWQAAFLWARLDLRWRIVSSGGTVLTSFHGPYAEDVRAYAEALDALDAFEVAAEDPACVPRAEHSCWTAFELWVYLEDWAAERCATAADDPDALP